jgi:hypothetical protein
MDGNRRGGWEGRKDCQKRRSRAGAADADLVYIERVLVIDLMLQTEVNAVLFRYETEQIRKNSAYAEDELEMITPYPGKGGRFGPPQGTGRLKGKNGRCFAFFPDHGKFFVVHALL